MADKKALKAAEEAAALQDVYAEEDQNYRYDLTKEENEQRRFETKELRIRTEKHIHAQIQLIEHLRACLDRKHAQIKATSTDCIQLQKKLDVDDAVADSEEISKLQAEFDEAKGKLMGEINLLKDENETFQKFEREEDMLKERLKAFTLAIEDEKQALERDLKQLEVKNAMEKDKLKNEMLRKIRETKLSLLEMTQDQLHPTTKRTIVENEMMTTELQYQSKQYENFMKQHRTLTSQCAKHHERLHRLRQEKHAMTEQSHMLSLLAKKLQTKANQLELLLKDNAAKAKEKAQQSAIIAEREANNAPQGKAQGGNIGGGITHRKHTTTTSSSTTTNMNTKTTNKPTHGALHLPKLALPLTARGGLSMKETVSGRGGSSGGGSIGVKDKNEQERLMGMSIRQQEEYVKRLAQELQEARRQEQRSSGALAMAKRASRQLLGHIPASTSFILDQLDEAWNELLKIKQGKAIEAIVVQQSMSAAEAMAKRSAVTQIEHGINRSHMLEGSLRLPDNVLDHESAADAVSGASKTTESSAAGGLNQRAAEAKGGGEGTLHKVNEVLHTLASKADIQMQSGVDSVFMHLAPETRSELIDMWFYRLHAGSTYSEFHTSAKEGADAEGDDDDEENYSELDSDEEYEELLKKEAADKERAEAEESLRKAMEEEMLANQEEELEEDDEGEDEEERAVEDEEGKASTETGDGQVTEGDAASAAVGGAGEDGTREVQSSKKKGSIDKAAKAARNALIAAARAKKNAGRVSPRSLLIRIHEREDLFSSLNTKAKAPQRTQEELVDPFAAIDTLDGPPVVPVPAGSKGRSGDAAAAGTGAASDPATSTADVGAAAPASAGAAGAPRDTTNSASTGDGAAGEGSAAGLDASIPTDPSAAASAVAPSAPSSSLEGGGGSDGAPAAEAGAN